MKKPPKKLLFFTLVSLCLSTSCDVPPVQENSAETSPNDSNNKIHFDYFVYLELEDGTIFSDQEAPIAEPLLRFVYFTTNPRLDGAPAAPFKAH